MCVCVSHDTKAFSVGARVTQQPTAEEHRQHRWAVSEMVQRNEADTDRVCVFYNGEILGHIGDACAFAKQIQRLPLGDGIHMMASAVVTFDGTLYVNTDEGRVVRPLLSVEWWTTGIRVPFGTGTELDTLIESGAVRYVDAAECGALDIALTPRTLDTRIDCNYLEIHPSLMLGVTAACIPFIQ